jgi:hypothetical protein
VAGAGAQFRRWDGEGNSFPMITSHFETSIKRTTDALTALISDLRRTAQYFDIDIEVEETRARVSDLQSADYPGVARLLRSRRDNLLTTIAMLETAQGLHAEQHIKEGS